MTETLPVTKSLQAAKIRGYRPADHGACRHLWAELIEHRSELYGEAPAGESDAGAGFEEYLTQLNLSGMWVADFPEVGVAGFIGLMLDGRTGEVDPVIVTARLRGQGVGRALLAKVADEARRRGLRRLTISPSVRDTSALRALHTAGFGTVATVTLSYDVPASSGKRKAPSPVQESSLDLFDLRFDV